MMRENAYLSDQKIHQLNEKLLGEKERILNKNPERETYCLDQNELSDPLDEASVNVQTSQEIRFRNRENFYLKKIDKALRKIEEGRYGLCEDCDAKISFERLMARATAELCINCKEESELKENANFFLKRSKSLGRTMQEIGKR